jgi:IclR family acetate operon transcriptional repressor
MPVDDSVGVLARITAIFEVLGDNDDGIGVSELAARAGLPKSTVSRLVSALVRRHYLERDGTTVRLGLRLFELGQLAPTPQLLRRAALPVMSALRTDTGGDVELAVRDGADLVRLAVVRGRSSPAAPGAIGDRTPALATVQGRASLALAPLAEFLPGAAVAVAASPVTAMIGGVDAVLSVTLATHDDSALGHLASAVSEAAAAIELRL